jgi:integrase
LNADAVEEVRRRLGRHPAHVFTYRDKTVTQVSTKAWYAALKQVEVANFRWHDLLENGTPLFALQEMGGWASAETVRQYGHLAANHLTLYAERRCATRAVEEKIHGTFTAQTCKRNGFASLQAVDLLVARTCNPARKRLLIE